MIVMMSDVAQEDRAIGSVAKPSGVLQRERIFGSPPGVEMRSVTAAQSRSTPTAVDAGGRLVMQAAGVEREPLQQKRSPPAQGISAMLAKFFQELLVAEERICWPCSLEGVEKLKLLHVGHGNPRITTARGATQPSIGG